MILLRPSVLLGTALTFVLGGIAVAIPLSSAVASQSTAPARRTLETVLPDLRWDAARGGPLLLIDPAGTPLAPGAELPTAASRGRLVADVAPLFARKLSRFGTLAALVPVEMVRLNPDPADPDPFADMGESDRMLWLLDSLSDAQWQQLGSATGLGASDLKPEQQRLFLSLLPDPFMVRQHVPGAAETSPGRTLTEAERRSVRLRFQLDTVVTLPPQDPARSRYVLSGTGYRRRSQSYWETYTDPALNRPKPSAYGSALKASFPNRAKPSDLNFAARGALDAIVLLPAEATVGNLVRAAAKATHLELYADPRYARLPVRALLGLTGPQAVARTVRAGDLLQSLCLALTGTIRAVKADGGTAYVLTDDSEGLGTRHARLIDWQEDGAARALLSEAGRRERMQKRNPIRFLSFARDDPYALSSSAGQEGTLPRQSGLRLTDLTPALQEMIRDRIRPDRARFDAISLEVHANTQYVVPGVGEVEETRDTIGMSSAPEEAFLNEAASAPPPKDFDWSFPAALPSRALRTAAPADAAEARRIIAAAKRCGFTEVWIEPAAGESIPASALLTEAAAAGSTQKVAVYAVVRPFRTPPGTPGADLNIFGEGIAGYAARRRTSPKAQVDPFIGQQMSAVAHDFRTPGDASLSAIARRVEEAARIPGLIGIVFEETCPPGYEGPWEARPRESIQDLGPEQQGMDMGYAPEARLAFLRQTNMDPIDLPRPYRQRGGGDLELPLFTFAGSPNAATQEWGRRWDRFRQETNTRRARELIQRASTANSRLRIVLGSRPTRRHPTNGSWFCDWRRQEAGTVVAPLPTHQEDPTRFPEMSRALHAQRRRLLLPLVANGDGRRSADEKARLKTDLRNLCTRVQSWQSPARGQEARDGIVLDMRGRTVEEALELLAKINSSASGS